MALRKTELIVGIFVSVMALMGIVEALRSISEESLLLEDAIGPGGYLFGLSIIMMTVAILYLLITQYRKKMSLVKVSTDEEMSLKVITMITTIAIYILLIYITGYLLATVIFFLLIFRVVGFKSWFRNVLASIAASITLYIVFVQLLRLIFPRGILFP